MTRRVHQTQSRRDFISKAGAIGAGAAAFAVSIPRTLDAMSPTGPAVPGSPARADLEWVGKLATASDRAVFDSPEIAGGLAVEVASRFLDNCDAVYGVGHHSARAVVNLRARGVAIALTDAAWERYKLGAEYDVQDPATPYDPFDPGTWRPALRNPFRGPALRPQGTSSVEQLVSRGAIILACDFTLARLAASVARRAKTTVQLAHDDLRASLIPGVDLVASGVFGLAKAQNAGCAFVPYPA
jgi:hypothetical protein